MSDSSEDDHYDESLWEASDYRSRYFRSERDGTSALALSSLGPTKVKALPWSPHLRAILCGVRDPSNPLSVFRGHESFLVKKIYRDLVETLCSR